MPTYQTILGYIRCFYRLRHDGVTTFQYGTFGPILTRRNTVSFWIRQARTIQPKVKN